jgi:hypothetical protein
MAVTVFIDKWLTVERQVYFQECRTIRSKKDCIFSRLRQDFRVLRAKGPEPARRVGYLRDPRAENQEPPVWESAHVR